MIKIRKSLIAMLAVSALLIGISGCKKNGTTAEEVGKEIDQKVEEAGKKIDSAVDTAKQKIDAAVDKTGQKIEKTGKSMQD